MSIQIKKCGPVRFSYMHVYAPRQNEDGTPGKYDATLLIDKNDKALVAAIQKAINDAYADGVQSRWNGKKPQAGFWRTPLGDGDLPNDNGDPRPESFRGHYFLNAKSLSKPPVMQLVDGKTDAVGRVLEAGNIQPLMNTEDFFPGCYGYASIAFGAYDNKGKKGVSCYLNAIIFTRQGEAFGARTDPYADFSDLGAKATTDDEDFFK